MWLSLKPLNWESAAAFAEIGAGGGVINHPSNTLPGAYMWLDDGECEDHLDVGHFTARPAPSQVAFNMATRQENHLDVCDKGDVSMAWQLKET
ncbi:unnamed protein product [Clonostachys byssicola]|uniref:Uncharacterized protein n=1 Tax=Clonostachys byssicola TaxID=160290 RepID=A0A9N9XZ04_9HYPO|nr:unnamed protein product [Clonostachys byssicola]